MRDIPDKVDGNDYLPEDIEQYLKTNQEM